jgi:hypothetical protein
MAWSINRVLIMGRNSRRSPPRSKPNWKLVLLSVVTTTAWLQHLLLQAAAAELQRDQQKLSLVQYWSNSNMQQQAIPILQLQFHGIPHTTTTTTIIIKPTQVHNTQQRTTSAR